MLNVFSQKHLAGYRKRERIDGAVLQILGIGVGVVEIRILIHNDGHRIPDKPSIHERSERFHSRYIPASAHVSLPEGLVGHPRHAGSPLPRESAAVYGASTFRK